MKGLGGGLREKNPNFLRKSNLGRFVPSFILYSFNYYEQRTGLDREKITMKATI